MTSANTTVIMAGAREAHDLARALVSRGRQVVASLPEPERMFDALPVPTRISVFETDAACADWVRASQARAVIDASHAFDHEISDRVARVCGDLRLPILRVLRPPWSPTPCDHWREVRDIAAAMVALPGNARVFSNTGWPTVPDYAGFCGERLFMRQTQETLKSAIYSWMEFIAGTPPFTQFEEEALFGKLGITHLICRNVGGAASMSKLLAARAMGLPVFMIARPALPADVPRVETVAEALAWEAQV